MKLSIRPEGSQALARLALAALVLVGALLVAALMLPETAALIRTARSGPASLMAMDESLF